MTCEKCGKQLYIGSTFCGYCGAPTTPEESTNQQNPKQDTTNTIQEQPQKKSSTGTKILIVVVVLILGFGGLAVVGGILLVSINPQEQLAKARCVSECSKEKDQDACIAMCSEEENYEKYAAKDGETATQSWDVFNSSKYLFEASFPEEPELEPEVKDNYLGIDLSYTSFSSYDTQEGTTYLISIYDYEIPASEYDNKSGLKGAVEGFVNEIENTELTSLTYGFTQGYNTVNYSAHNPTDDVYINGIAIVRDDLNIVRMYHLTVISYGNPSSNYNKFIDSFEITD